MRQAAEKPIIVPFDKGFYGGIGDSETSLTANNFIPLGFFYGTDIVNDDCGFLRARPEIGYLVPYNATPYSGYAAADYPIANFKLGTDYYAIMYGKTVYKCTNMSTGAWTAATPKSPETNLPLYASRINVDFMGNQSVTPDALITTGSTYTLGGTPGTFVGAISPNATATAPEIVMATVNCKGLGAHDEGRLWVVNPTDQALWYSTRFNYDAGMENNNWLTIPEVCDTIIMMRNIAGSMYVIQSSDKVDRIYIWKKVGSYSSSAELLDFTSFQQILGVDDACIRNGCDAISAIGGSIVFWAYGSGLNIIAEKGTQVVSEPLQGWNPAGLNYDCIVATDQRSKYIFVKEAAAGTTTYVYDITKGVWSLWNINVTCKGFGKAGGMFGIKGTPSPIYVKSFPTTATDTTIVPTMVTPVLDFGQPDREKFITSIHCSARGVSSIAVYTRLTPDDNFALLTTITSPEQISVLTGDHRFGECYFKIIGTPLFVLKEFKILYDLGDYIFEV